MRTKEVFHPERIDRYTKETLNQFCDHLAAKDKRIRQIITDLGYPPFWHREPGFESLVKIILEQQVSLASAFSVHQKLQETLGAITPEAILNLTEDGFKRCGFSRQKKAYVLGLAEAVDCKRLNLDTLPDQDIDTIRTELTKLKGIGHWTTDVYLLSCLHKLDVFPIGDLALIKSMVQAGFIKEKESRESILRKTKKFQPYRSIFTVLLWHRYIRTNKIKVPFDL